jgi:trigger factor
MKTINVIANASPFVIVHFMKVTTKTNEHSEVEIQVTLPYKDIEPIYNKVKEDAINNMEVDGFRKGKVPQDIAEKNINTMKILEETAHRAISEKYIDILKQEDIKAIGQPNISITKIAEGSDLEFKIVTAVLPEVSLGDYKKIAKDINKKEKDLEVSDADVDKALLNLRKMKAQRDISEQAQKEKEDNSEEEKEQKVPGIEDIKEEDLPELNDELAKEFGPFEGVDDLKTKLKENLKAEKESKAIEKVRIETIDTILESAKIEVPKMMVDYELDKMMHEFEGNISMSGMKFDEYLSSINKTRDDYRKEWKEQANKRAKTQLMLNHIAAHENIEPSDEEIDAEVTKIMNQYKDQNIQENSVKAYVSSVLTHQKVFEFLERQ